MKSNTEQPGYSPEHNSLEETQRLLEEAQQVIKEREARINFLLANFFDVYFRVDDNWQFTEIKGDFENIFHRPVNGLLGENIWKVFPELVNLDLYQKAQTAVQSASPQRLNGQVLPWSGWLEVFIQPGAKNVEFSIRSITDYQQSEPQTGGDEKARVLFDSLLENIPEGIIIADAKDLSFLVVSRYGYQMLGLPDNSLQHKTLADLLKQVDFFRMDGITRYTVDDHPMALAIQQGKRAEDHEMVLRSAKGQTLMITTKHGPVYNQNGEIIAGIFSWMDVTESRNDRDRLSNYASVLERTNKELEAFAYTASHDLQEPLRKIRGFSEMLQKRLARFELEPEEQDLFTRIAGATTRMQRLINGLLIYSRVTGRKGDFELTDLNQVVQDAIKDTDVVRYNKDTEIEVAELPTIFALPSQMHQLFANLIGNAVKFRREGVDPHVRIYVMQHWVEKDVEWFEIAVEDNGIGFDPKHLDQIFLPFVRLHGRMEFDGSGIGLAICQKIVDNHGGSISAESTPGEGATFIIRLPKTQQASIRTGGK